MKCLEQPFVWRKALPVQGSLSLLLEWMIKLKMVPCSLAPGGHSELSHHYPLLGSLGAVGETLPQRSAGEYLKP